MTLGQSLEIDTRLARRLALRRAGLLGSSRLTDLPARAAGRGRRAREAAHRIIDRFGYLQLDTVAVAGARSHALVLGSRLDGFDLDLAEELLQPGRPLFEYWGHEASWIPLELYPHFEFRRRAFRRHPWWGDIITPNQKEANALLRRIREDGPVRSLDLEGKNHGPWWGLKLSKRIANALWSSGELAIRERRAFQRVYDLAERVIPSELRNHTVPEDDVLKTLILKALDGHGWATSGHIAATWRLRKMQSKLDRLLNELHEAGRIRACTLVQENPGSAPPSRGRPSRDRSSRDRTSRVRTSREDRTSRDRTPRDRNEVTIGTGRPRRTRGWIRSEHVELLGPLERVRPRADRGRLLSPFDPLIWERRRVANLFGFDYTIEIFKPVSERTHGYYCLPILAGERLIGRIDLKARRADGQLDVRGLFFGSGLDETARPSARLGIAGRPGNADERDATLHAIRSYARSVGLPVRWTSAQARCLETSAVLVGC